MAPTTASPLHRAWAVPSQACLHQLLLLNISLQLFDGVASYHGVRWWGEGNPLISEAMVTLGIGPALLLYKAKACGVLVLLRRVTPPRTTLAAYAVVAVAYGTMSFVPWLVRLGSLLGA